MPTRLRIHSVVAMKKKKEKEKKMKMKEKKMKMMMMKSKAMKNKMSSCRAVSSTPLKSSLIDRCLRRR